MDIVIDPALQAYIDPLTPEEHDALERSLLAEGCRDALVLWGQVLVDGHNRYGICTRHGLPFQTVQNPRFQSMDDVHLWMIDQHLGRRSVSNFQRGLLALRKREILEARRAQAMAADAPAAQPAAGSAGGSADVAPWDEAGATPPGSAPASATDTGTNTATHATTRAPISPAAAQEAAALSTREDLARLARLSSAQVQMIEKIQKQAAPEVVAAVRAGALSINAAAAVASLPAEEQVAAAAAGPDELKQAARRAREAKRKPKAEAAASAEGSAAEPATAAPAEGTTAAPSPQDAEIAALQHDLALLRQQNDALRRQVAVLQQELAELRAPI